MGNFHKIFTCDRIICATFHPRPVGDAWHLFLFEHTVRKKNYSTPKEDRQIDYSRLVDSTPPPQHPHDNAEKKQTHPQTNDSFLRSRCRDDF